MQGINTLKGRAQTPISKNLISGQTQPSNYPALYKKYNDDGNYSIKTIGAN
jgi:hypothetical protein